MFFIKKLKTGASKKVNTLADFASASLLMRAGANQTGKTTILLLGLLSLHITFFFFFGGIKYQTAQLCRQMLALFKKMLIVSVNGQSGLGIKSQSGF